jgi:3-methylcrotonyl-CoA carboxylase alpha subunit
MEMNTRLQVEHPVTEEITGQDLVEWQLRVASGEKLPKSQDQLKIRGHAIEARLYAEDPANDFLPSVGRLEFFGLPACLEPYEYVAVNNSRQTYEYDSSLRLETGFEEGDEVSPFYDPMIAKLIVSGSDRVNAIIGLTRAVSESRSWPVRTNASMLYSLLVNPDFTRGRLTTSFIDDHSDDVIFDEEPGGAQLMLVSREIPSDLIGFRLNGEPNDYVWLSDGKASYKADLSIELLEGHDHHFPAEKVGEAVFATSVGKTSKLTFNYPRGGVGAATAADGAILAPMPGKVTSVEVSKGEKVATGQRLLTLEAMKMEHGLVAPFDGVVAELNARAGAQVQVDAVLAVIEPTSSPA